MSFVASGLLALGLGDVWSILDSLQVITNTQLCDVRTPGNVNAFNTLLGDITSIEVFDFDTFILYYIYTPEMMPESLNFQNEGFQTILFLITARSALINMIALILLGLANVILAVVRRCIHHKLLK